MDSLQGSAGRAALAAAVGGLLYGYFFVIAGNVGVASTLLLIGGLLSSLIFVALGSSLSDVSQPIARWATLIGVAGSMLSVVHAGYDLANQIHPPGTIAGNFPNPADPRGLATFGLSGLGILVLSTLMTRSASYPSGLARTGQLLGVVMIVIYLGRLIILDPTNTVVRIALALGVIANTIFLVWLGRHWLATKG